MKLKKFTYQEIIYAENLIFMIRKLIRQKKVDENISNKIEMIIALIICFTSQIKKDSSCKPTNNNIISTRERIQDIKRYYVKILNNENVVI